jgi:hypothetical protein
MIRLGGFFEEDVSIGKREPCSRTLAAKKVCSAREELKKQNERLGV